MLYVKNNGTILIIMSNEFIKDNRIVSCVEKSFIITSLNYDNDANSKELMLDLRKETAHIH